MFIAAVLVSGCAQFRNELPVLGLLENGNYTQPDRAFRCPVPGHAQGFSDSVRVEDAAQDIKTRRVMVPQSEYRAGWPIFRDEVIYPIGAKPNHTVSFLDAADENQSLAIQFRPLRENEDPETAYRTGYGGSNIGMLFEARRQREGVEYDMAIVQYPYHIKDRPYGGIDPWRAYLNGDKPGPVIETVFNIIQNGQHYYFTLRTSSLDKLPAGVNPKDLMAVYDALGADLELLTELEDRLWTLVRQCRFAPLD